MCYAHMCTLAIVMATCSYGIYFWRRGGNRLKPSVSFVWARLQMTGYLVGYLVKMQINFAFCMTILNC